MPWGLWGPWTLPPNMQVSLPHTGNSGSLERSLSIQASWSLHSGRGRHSGERCKADSALVLTGREQSCMWQQWGRELRPGPVPGEAAFQKWSSGLVNKSQSCN